MTDNLEDIIAGCLANDRHSQEKLYNLLSPKMFGVCLRYATDYDEACDLLQEGFIRVFTKMDSYRGEGSFEGWVRRIMVNTSLQSIRRRRQMYLINEDLTENIELPANEIDSGLETEDLLRLVRKLPVNQRMVFNLFAIEGYNHAEIAEMTGIPENTSKSHLHRARLALKLMLEKSTLSENQMQRKNV